MVTDLFLHPRKHPLLLSYLGLLLTMRCTSTVTFRNPSHTGVGSYSIGRVTSLQSMHAPLGYRKLTHFTTNRIFLHGSHP